MLSKSKLSKPLLALSLVSLLSLGAGTAVAEQAKLPTKVTVDPATGNVVEREKFLSEMTPQEKAKLSKEQVKQLEVVEAVALKDKEKPKY